LADVRGISIQAISKLRQSGIVVRVEAGRYDHAESCKRYIASHRKQSEAPRPRRGHGLPRARPRLPTWSDAAELVEADQVEMCWSRIVSTVRTRLLAIPAKCAARVRMASTIVEVAAILREEIYAALRELSRTEVIVDDPPSPHVSSV
jgi:phage terminase Nu1 subunit (DNA packaging protein)